MNCVCPALTGVILDIVNRPNGDQEEVHSECIALSNVTMCGYSSFVQYTQNVSPRIWGCQKFFWLDSVGRTAQYRCSLIKWDCDFLMIHLSFSHIYKAYLPDTGHVKSFLD